MNSEIAAVQQRLTELGFAPGLIDGEYGKETEAAVRAFQVSRGLEVDGVAGPQTRVALGILVSAVGDPPWLPIARGHLGLAEIKGPHHNPKVVDLWREGRIAGVTDDETTWCATISPGGGTKPSTAGFESAVSELMQCSVEQSGSGVAAQMATRNGGSTKMGGGAPSTTYVVAIGCGGGEDAKSNTNDPTNYSSGAGTIRAPSAGPIMSCVSACLCEVRIRRCKVSSFCWLIIQRRFGGARVVAVQKGAKQPSLAASPFTKKREQSPRFL